MGVRPFERRRQTARRVVMKVGSQTAPQGRDIEELHIAAMDLFFTDAAVTGWASLVASIELPDPGDRHVVAAAVVGGADAIVTANLTDFPASTLAGCVRHRRGASRRLSPRPMEPRPHRGRSGPRRYRRQRPEVTVTEILDQLSPSRRTPVLRPRRAHPNPTPTGMRKGKSDPGTWSAESGPYSGERRQAEESIIRRRGHCPREHHRRPPTPLPRTPGAPWSAHRPCPTARARRGAVDTWSVLERHRCLLSRPVRIIGTAITLRVQRAGTGKRFRG